jgi:hypothetical protein
LPDLRTERIVVPCHALLLSLICGGYGVIARHRKGATTAKQ